MSKSKRPEIRRNIKPASHLHVRSTGTGKRLSGYAASFNQLSLDLGGFQERIAPGAFSDSLRSNPVKLLLDHNSEKLAASSASGTLQVSEDSYGLRFDASLPSDVSYVSDAISLLQRGDAPGEMSFGFSVNGSDGDSWDVEGDTLVRTLRSVTLYEISLLTGNDPAYAVGTSAGLRSRKPCLTNCPINLRSRITLRDYDDDVCDEDGEEYDEDACNDRDMDDVTDVLDGDVPCDGTCCEQCSKKQHRDCRAAVRCSLRSGPKAKGVGWYRPDGIMGRQRSKARDLETQAAHLSLLMRRLRS